MADIELIKPRELPEQANVQATDAIMVDNGTVVGKATPEKIVNAGAPVASEAEALAGVNNTKRMTPLRVRQVLDNVNNPAVLRAQAWAESSTPPDPLLPDSKSAKTWASIAEQGTVMVQWSMIAADGQTVLGNDITTGEPIRAFGGVAQISVNGFGPITPEEYSVDSDGVVTLTAPLAEGDVVSGFTQPRLSNSEAQAVVQGVLQQTGADVAAAQEAAAAAAANAALVKPQFDSVAQLQDDTAMTDATVPVGWTVSVNGIGGYVRVSSGGDIVTAGGIRFDVLPDDAGRYNALAFGAKNDGSDDTEAIQRAISKGLAYLPWRGVVWKASKLDLRGSAGIVGDKVSASNSYLSADVYEGTPIEQIAGVDDWFIELDASGFVRSGGFFVDFINIRSNSNGKAFRLVNTHRWEFGTVKVRGAVEIIDTFDFNWGNTRLTDAPASNAQLRLSVTDENDNTNNIYSGDLTLEGFKGRALELIGASGGDKRVNKMYWDKLKIETVKTDFSGDCYVFAVASNTINLGRVDLTWTKATSLPVDFIPVKFGGPVSSVTGVINFGANGSSGDPTNTIKSLIELVDSGFSGDVSGLNLDIGLAGIWPEHISRSLIHIGAHQLRRSSFRLYSAPSEIVEALDSFSLPIYTETASTGSGSIEALSVSFTDARGVQFATAGEKIMPMATRAFRVRGRNIEPSLQIERRDAANSLSSIYHLGRMAANNIFKIVGYVAGVSGEQTYLTITPAKSVADGSHKNVCTGLGDNTSGGWNNGHWQLGQNHIWVDATGTLRIKSSAPTSDTDGTVVGTQS